MGFSLNTYFWLQILLVLLSSDAKINPAHNYAKLSLFREYLAFHKFDIICLSETYLNSSNSSDDETLEIFGYLYECINFEIMIGNKICNFITVYRSPSLNQDDFQVFIDNHEMNLETLAQRNAFLTVVIGDFNAKSKHWCGQDTTNFEGITIENVTS